MEQALERVETNIILDTEFNSQRGGWRIEPISFALITEDGDHEFYGVRRGFNQKAAEGHPFLRAQVLPKIPAVEERLTDQQLLKGVKAFLQQVVQSEKCNRLNIWAKNGGMGDFILMDLLFKGHFYEYMNSIGVGRTYFKDTYTLREKAGFPQIDITQPLETRHCAQADVRHERLVFLEIKKILAQKLSP